MDTIWSGAVIQEISEVTLKAYALLVFALLGPTVFAYSQNTLGGPSQTVLQESKVFEDKYHDKSKTKAELIPDFARLPPPVRVQVWMDAWLKKNSLLNSSEDAMREALIARGTDAVPPLVQLIRSEGRQRMLRILAVRILCSMDKFVLLEEMPSWVRSRTMLVRYFEFTDFAGAENPFQPLDGRRIGKEGLDTIHWAADQSADREVRFYAGVISGLLEQSFRRLSLEEVFQRWRTAVIRDGGHFWGQDDSTFRALGPILIAHAPESLPMLIDAVSDKNAYVRFEAIGLLEQTDLCRTRLRGTESGRRAITAIQDVLVNKHGYKGSAQERLFSAGVFANGEKLTIGMEWWRRLSTQFNDNGKRLDMATRWRVYAQAFDEFHGERLTQGYKFRPGAEAEMLAFLSYMTQVDASFPSWEFDDCTGGSGWLDFLHPDFEKKVGRYYDQWNTFKRQSEGTDHTASPSKN